jgi:hypothetical protein
MMIMVYNLEYRSYFIPFEALLNLGHNFHKITIFPGLAGQRQGTRLIFWVVFFQPELRQGNPEIKLDQIRWDEMRGEEIR